MNWPFKKTERCQLCGKHIEGKRLFTQTRFSGGQRSTYLVHKDCKNVAMRSGGAFKVLSGYRQGSRSA